VLRAPAKNFRSASFRLPEPRWVPSITEFQFAEIPHEPGVSVGRLVGGGGCSLRAFGSAFKHANSSQWFARAAAALPLPHVGTRRRAATALLWSSAGDVALMLPLWFRRPLTLVAERAAWPERHEPGSRFALICWHGNDRRAVAAGWFRRLALASASAISISLTICSFRPAHFA
jgi:hypothetical protein